jgi:HlyD family secretion protein
VDLARCNILAPIDGIVISRDVNVGQTVAASLSAPKLFVIANDLAKMQIEAKVSEADIGRIQVNQDVKFTVDAFPGETFRGQVTQVRNMPAVDQNVVMYDTIIEVKNPELKLKPGMTANVTIIVAHRDGVLKIPGAALRFRPPRNVEVKKDVEVKKIEMAEASAESAKKPDGTTGKKDKKEKKSKRTEQSVYLLRDGALHSTRVKLGITDGRETELTEGLKEGDAVIVDMAESKQSPKLMSRLLAAIKKKGD